MYDVEIQRSAQHYFSEVYLKYCLLLIYDMAVAENAVGKSYMYFCHMFV
jgi:hypothetical protein